MKFTRNALIAFLCVLLVIGLILFVMYGCMNFSAYTSSEHFEDKKAADKKDKEEDKKEEVGATDLSDKEKELFEDLKENKLSNEQITELVSGGVLTEKLIEKFLNQLNVTPEDGKPTTSTTKAPPVHKDEEEFTIEGFSANQSMFAKF